MTRRTKIWLIAAGVFVLYLLLALVFTLVFKPHGVTLWVLWIALTLLGAFSAALILWYFREPASSGAAPDDLVAVLGAAKAKLASTKAAGHRLSLRNMPAVLVVGARGSAKTSVVVRSGIEPELLAGDVFRGEAVTPTRGANVWFTQDMLYVEGDGDLLADAGRWRTFARFLAPQRLVAAVTGGAQAPRVAVVCVSCEDFYKPNAAPAMNALATTLRQRLVEVSQQFGTRLPVYVMFTKADTIPHFEAFAHNLSPDEAREIIGAAVAPDDGPVGTYADRATPRLQAAFQQLIQSLSLARLRLLPRDGTPLRRLAAYEFPREMRKLTPMAVEFLRDICKPGQLAVSPVLRGFWFTGVQAVVIPNVMRPEIPQQERVAAANAQSATQVFSQLLGGHAATTPAPAAARERKVARWVALPRFFHDVVLGDTAALDLARGGTGLNFLRRSLLVAGIAAVALLAIGMTVSFANNRALERSVRVAAQSFAELPASDVDLPALGTLQRLDSLRMWIDTLRRWDSDGAPMRYRWGLYAGGSLYGAVRHVYFAGFDKVLFHGTFASMLSALRTMPDVPRPTDDYEASYNLLKTYLVATSHPKESAIEFARPVLLTYWQNGRRADPERLGIAQRQFETYVAELRANNPFTLSADAAAVTHARGFLRQFAGSEHIYQYMLTEAGRTNPSVVFNQRVPGSAAVLPVPYEVPGAFTKGGWTFMQTALGNVTRFFGRETWVLGDETRMSATEQASVQQALSARYAADYVDAWRKFLGSATVTRYANIKDAAQKLSVLSGNQSPLLALFATTSRETAVSTPAIAQAFSSVQTLVPPLTKDKLIVEANAPYVNALATLQASLDQVAGQHGAASEAAASQAQSNAITAKTAAHQITAAFTLAADAEVNASVQRLLDAPVTYAEALIKKAGAIEVNARARTFCAGVRPLLAKFPFNPDATAEVSMAELSAVLRPGTGSLWTLYNDALQNVLQKQGTQYVPSGGGSVKLSIGFVQLFNRLATLSDALFHDDVTEPRQRWSVQPHKPDGTQSVSVTIEGQTGQMKKSVVTMNVTWPSGGRESKLTYQIGNNEYTAEGPFNGTWGAFRLFFTADASNTENGGTTQRLEWELTTRTQRNAAPGSSPRIVVDVNAGPMGPLFKRGYLTVGTSGCSGDVAN